MNARWFVPIALALMTAACGSAPSFAPTARVAQAAEAERWLKPYPKTFYDPVKPAKFPVQILAHRGYAKVAPENTLAAFNAAIAADADVLELDVHVSKDGHLVVMHDDDVARTTDGKGPIEEMTLEQIKALDAGGWFGEQFKGERVPTLDEVLAIAKGRANVMIELKGRNVPKLPPLVSQAIERNQMAKQVMVSSFYTAPMAAFHKLQPSVPLGALVLPGFSMTGRAGAMLAGTVQPNVKSIDKVKVAALHAFGLKVHVWTVNAPADIRRAAEAGVDGLITDDVEGCQKELQALYWQSPAPTTP